MRNKRIIIIILSILILGIIIIETDEPERDINRINNMNINYKIYDLRKYGRVSLIFLK